MIGGADGWQITMSDTRTPNPHQPRTSQRSAALAMHERAKADASEGDLEARFPDGTRVVWVDAQRAKDAAVERAETAERERDDARGTAETLAVALSVEINRPPPALPWKAAVVATTGEGRDGACDGFGGEDAY